MKESYGLHYSHTSPTNVGFFFLFFSTMSNNTITIEKSKYRALLERVFQLEIVEHGTPLSIAIGSRIEYYGSNMSRNEMTLAQMRSSFTDIALLADYVELVAGDEFSKAEKESTGEIEQIKSHHDDTFGH